MDYIVTVAGKTLLEALSLLWGIVKETFFKDPFGKFPGMLKMYNPLGSIGTSQNLQTVCDDSVENPSLILLATYVAPLIVQIHFGHRILAGWPEGLVIGTQCRRPSGGPYVLLFTCFGETHAS